MTRVELSESWSTSLSLEILKNKIKEMFLLHKIKVVSEDQTEIRGKQGSQFQTRGGGGIWVNPK